MLKKKQLADYLNKRWTGLRACLQKISIEGDEKTIHDLRLHSKKLKAVQVLMGEKYKYLNKPLKPMIAAAGNIRTAEMHIKILAQHQFSNEVLLQGLHTQVVQGYVQVKQNVEEYLSAAKHAKEAWNKVLQPLDDKLVLHFIEKTLSSLAAAFAGLIKEDELHENRKQIKQLMYVSKLLPKRLHEKVKLDDALLDELQEAIGDWHDLQMTLGLLSSHRYKRDIAYSVTKKAAEEKFGSIRLAVKKIEWN